MKLYWNMPKTIRPYYETELEQYQQALSNNQLQMAWHHLERAHILGQRYPHTHNYVHWKMLLFGVKIKSSKEVIGQIPRLLVGGVKSFVGKVPIGNPGGANVPALKPFPISLDLQIILNKATS
jgi:hypothetical protein